MDDPELPVLILVVAIITVCGIIGVGIAGLAIGMGLEP